tara:strand:- start:1417 stop:1638 length:222 start_codon:yes stop_codon:yes gene_type:complete
MGFMKPPPPPPIPPVPPPPAVEPADPYFEEQLRKQEKKRFGRKDTIVTGPQGLLADEEIMRPSLLAEYGKKAD